jgi:predicted metal-dependent peptidase
MATDSVVDKIVIARIGLLLRHPFFGNMATRLKVVDASDWCKTAATDGRNLFYNHDFLSKMDNKEVEFVVAHEIWHNVLGHIGRTEERNPKIWNAAIDYATNGLLVRDRIGTQPKGIKIYHDPKHYGKSSEQIYDEIYDEEDGKDLDQLGQLLDEHIDWESGDGDSDGSGNKNGGGRPQYTKDELKQIRDEVREATIAAASAAGAGNTPGEIQRMIKDLTEPKMNWRQILRQQIQSTVRNDYSFSRPSRKGWHTGAILPGMQFDETIDIAISIDMSGSISDKQALDFLSEIKGIMDEYRDYKIKLWCFDTKVYNEQDFDAHGGNDITQYAPKGGGGTDFDVNWTYMKNNDINPKKFIMFTDGYPWGSWGDENYCDTVFIVHGNNSIVSPFGITAYYDESK